MKTINKDYQMEISLKVLILNMLNNWKIILCVSLIVMILFGGYRYYNYNNELSSNEYQIELDDYNSKRDALTKEIAGIYEDLKQMKEYSVNSIKMNINPYAMYKANKYYYIDFNIDDYKVNSRIQKNEMINSIIQAYILTYQNSDLYNYIKNHLSYEIDIIYLKEIMSITKFNYSNIFSINVIHTDENKCEEIFKLYAEYIEQEKSALEKSLYKHNLVSFDESVMPTVDTTIGNFQKNNKKLFNEKRNDLTLKENELLVLGLPQRISFMSVILYAFLGFCIGTFLIFGVLSYAYIESDIIRDIDYFKRRYNLMVLGVLQSNRSKGRFYYIDNMISRFRSNRTYNKTNGYNWIAAYLSSNVYSNSINKVLITGTANEELIKGIVSKLEKETCLSTLNIYYGANVSYNTDTILQLNECSDIVLIEKINESRNSEIIKQLEYLDNLGKNILGVIIVD